MKIAIYARVSLNDLDEDGKPKQHLDNQLIPLRSYALERGWVVVDEYRDTASGADPNRPELARLLRDARAHRFSRIIAVRFDRIARSVLDLEIIVRRIDAVGVVLECIEEPVHTDTPEGVAFRQLLSVFAELERAMISERTKAGLRRARKEGKQVGGCRIDLDLARLRMLRDRGYGCARIGRELGCSHQTVRNRLRECQIEEGAATPREKAPCDEGQSDGRSFVREGHDRP